MKFIVGFIALGLALMAFWKVIQSPESRLKKKSQKLIALASVGGGPQSEMNLISKVSKMAKYIHFDVQVRAEYEGSVYSARSLNEFRSLLLSYFKHGQTGKVDYENLTIQMEGKTQGRTYFDAHFERGSTPVVCKALFEWIKEKKWLIKKLELFSCKAKNL